MEIEYIIEENDFLDFQIFTASKSERIHKKKRNGWLALAIGSLLLTVYFYFKNQTLQAIYFGLCFLITSIFYPKYFRWRYKKHYKTYIKENYSNRFGSSAIITINNDSIGSFRK